MFPKVLAFAIVLSALVTAVVTIPVATNSVLGPPSLTTLTTLQLTPTDSGVTTELETTTFDVSPPIITPSPWSVVDYTVGITIITNLSDQPTGSPNYGVTQIGEGAPDSRDTSNAQPAVETSTVCANVDSGAAVDDAGSNISS